MDFEKATNSWRGWFLDIAHVSSGISWLSPFARLHFAPLSRILLHRRRRPRGFFRDSHELSRPSSSWHQCSEHRFSTCTLYVHSARLCDFDIMNVNVRLRLCLPAVLDAANILIRDTCSRCSKTYLADEDYHHGNRIKRLDPIPSDGKREARGISVIRSTFTSFVQCWM